MKGFLRFHREGGLHQIFFLGNHAVPQAEGQAKVCQPTCQKFRHCCPMQEPSKLPTRQKFPGMYHSWHLICLHTCIVVLVYHIITHEGISFSPIYTILMWYQTAAQICSLLQLPTSPEGTKPIHTLASFCIVCP